METTRKVETGIKRDASPGEARKGAADDRTFLKQQDLIATHGEQKRHRQPADAASYNDVIIFFHYGEPVPQDPWPVGFFGSGDYIAKPPLTPIT